ncbi:bifunctional phosphoglucose/phosphomannose isomerase [Candidatus Woesebacteria bacterium]|nr:bifunctional phosphoglucose/phosphomannose isomerase [Candidatus Woesebacteria bacterium]
MNALDDIKKIKELDKSGVRLSIEALPLQIQQAWNEVKNLPVPAYCSIAKNVIVSGMGGSALGGRIIDSLILDRVRTPIEVSTDFKLPNYANSETLVILSSYSGNTEETLSSALDAQKKNCQIFGIATGGKLAEFLNQNKYPGYIFKPSNNPSNQPRMSLGYSVSAILSVLSMCGFVDISDEEISGVCDYLKKGTSELDPSVPESNNIAKTIATKLYKKIPVIVASEHLLGSAHAFKNQLNENAKTFSTLFDLPELNHHLMEGLRFPAFNTELLHFLFFESSLYNEAIKKRYPLTEEVVSKNFVAYDIYSCHSDTKLKQIFEVLLAGSYIGFYLAMLYGIDPAPIPWVDYFKEKLSK